MPTIAPSVEACNAIRDRVNSGEDYALEVRAQVADEITEDLQDNTSHVVRVWIRKKLDTTTQDEIDALKLLKRQIALRLLNYVTTDWRVRIWEVDNSQAPVIERDTLHQDRSFIASVLCRAEVKP